jgi:hypothetical protein
LPCLHLKQKWRPTLPIDSCVKYHFDKVTFGDFFVEFSLILPPFHPPKN